MTCDGIYDLVIVGGGPGGLTAGIYAMRAALKTVLVEMGPPGGQVNLSDSVENWPGDEHIGGSELSMKMVSHAQSYGLEMRTEEVVAIDPGLEHHTVRLAGGGCLEAHAVILATGGSPRQLEIPGEKELYGKGVSYCAVCDGSFYKDKRVALIGHGDQAAKSALYLAGLCKEVIILSNLAEIETTTYKDQILSQPNIKEYFNARVLSIKGTDSVEAVEYSIKGGAPETIRVEGVFIEGGTPNSVIAREIGLELDDKGNIMVNRPDMTTRVEGVFAAGDVTGGIHQISKAVGEGACAAVSAALYLKKKKRKEKT
jgi:thioredoxin reductase (NADPH)